MPKRTLFAVPTVAVVVSLIASCGIKLEAPPIECGYRPSLVGAGKILRLENRSNEPLRDISIEIRAAQDKIVHTEAEIGARQVLEVGWKKLGGFEITADAEIEIRAKGYLLPLRVELADSGETQEDERE